ncbi:MAG: lactate dehydrogenase, partial [Gemmatimonadota bacterium]|nr:lactate dehydrogenase [Gemmatimonadota bacterium]
GELAARLSGGFQSGFTYPLATGTDLMSAALRISMGEEPGDLRPKFNRTACERAIIPEPGLITCIEGLKEARDLPGVANILTMYQVGDIYHCPTSNMGKFGNILAVADSRRELNGICKKALETIRITTVPETEKVLT